MISESFANWMSHVAVNSNSAALGSITLALLMAWLLAASSSTLAIVVRIPGTVLHELLHVIAASVFFAKPVKVDFKLRWNDSRTVLKLGGVACRRITMWNAWAVGLAPSILFWPASVGCQYAADLFDQHLFTQGVLIAAGSGILGLSAIPSATDIKIALRSSWLVLFALLIWYGLRQ